MPSLNTARMTRSFGQNTGKTKPTRTGRSVKKWSEGGTTKLDKNLRNTTLKIRKQTMSKPAALIALALASFTAQAEDCQLREVIVETLRNGELVAINRSVVYCDRPTVWAASSETDLEATGHLIAGYPDIQGNLTSGYAYVVSALGGALYNFAYRLSAHDEMFVGANENVAPLTSTISKSMVLDLKEKSLIEFEFNEQKYKLNITSVLMDTDKRADSD